MKIIPYPKAKIILTPSWKMGCHRAENRAVSLSLFSQDSDVQKYDHSVEYDGLQYRLNYPTVYKVVKMSLTINIFSSKMLTLINAAVG